MNLPVSIDVARFVPNFLSIPPRHRFFTGKGGVGKHHWPARAHDPSVQNADPLALAVERRAAQALSKLPEGLARLPRADIPLLGWNLVGVQALRLLFTRIDGGHLEEAAGAVMTPMLPGLGDLARRLALIPFQAEEPIGIERLAALSTDRSMRI